MIGFSRYSQGWSRIRTSCQAAIADALENARRGRPRPPRAMLDDGMRVVPSVIAGLARLAPTWAAAAGQLKVAD